MGRSSRAQEVAGTLARTLAMSAIIFLCAQMDLTQPDNAGCFCRNVRAGKMGYCGAVATRVHESETRRTAEPVASCPRKAPPWRELGRFPSKLLRCSAPPSPSLPLRRSRSTAAERRTRVGRSAATPAGLGLIGYGGPYGGYAYGPYYGGYGPPAYSWGGPVYYGYPRYYGGPGILAARSYYPRRIYRPYARVYGAGSDRCSAARPKARRSTQPGALLRQRRPRHPMPVGRCWAALSPPPRLRHTSRQALQPQEPGLDASLAHPCDLETAKRWESRAFAMMNLSKLGRGSRPGRRSAVRRRGTDRRLGLPRPSP